MEEKGKNVRRGIDGEKTMKEVILASFSGKKGGVRKDERRGKGNGMKK